MNRRDFLKRSTAAAISCACIDASTLAQTRALPVANATPSSGKTWVCPPCGLPCDKLTFDAPGSCSGCGMTLVPANGEEGPPKVAILLFNGVQLIDFAGPWEVFGTAGFLVHTVAEKPDTITAVFGEKVVPDFTFDNSPKADVVLVPGGGVSGQISNERLIRWIQEKASTASHVVSVCTGAFLLEKAGLLKGATATATYGMIEDLAGPDTRVVYDKRFVDNGKVITTAGLSAGIDGALHVVSRLTSLGNAQSVALDMEYNWDPEGSYARAALADRFLPDGLRFAKANVKGAKAEMVSTAGDRHRWQTRILISEPRTRAEVFDLMRQRIEENRAVGGMSLKTPHIAGAPRITIEKAPSMLRWTFRDDAGTSWNGRCSVAPAANDKWLVTFALAQSGA